MIIEPKIGRHVWYWKLPPVKTTDDGPERDLPEVGIVTYVWNNNLVNLFVLDHQANPRAELSVLLCQPDDRPGSDGHYAEWMPFQVRAQELADTIPPLPPPPSPSPAPASTRGKRG